MELNNVMVSFDAWDSAIRVEEREGVIEVMTPCGVIKGVGNSTTEEWYDDHLCELVAVTTVVYATSRFEGDNVALINWVPSSGLSLTPHRTGGGECPTCRGAGTAGIAGDEDCPQCGGSGSL